MREVGENRVCIRSLIITLFVFMMIPIGILIMGADQIAQGSPMEGFSQKKVLLPTISADKTIDLGAIEGGKKVTVMGAAYSPNGNYLAIWDVAGVAATHIIVWDLKSNKLQSHTDRLREDFGIYPNAVLTWTPDNKYITFGWGGQKKPIQFWDPMTGKLDHEVPPYVAATSLQFNKDGTKALASPGIGGNPKFRIYDTKTWSYQEFNEGEMYVGGVAWAPDGQVVAVGYWHGTTREGVGSVRGEKSDDGQAIKVNDLIARLIDPAGHLADRTKVLIPSMPKTVSSGNKEFTYYQSQTQSPLFVVSSLSGEVIAVGLGNLLNGSTLNMRIYATNADIREHKVPIAMQPRNIAISPDGRYLYLKGDARDESSDAARNLVIDTQTGSQLLWFHGGVGGIAIRRDGRQLAVGDGDSVKLFNID